MRIRTSWIDFEFGLSEKRLAAVNDDIELCAGRSVHVHSYTTDSPNQDKVDANGAESIINNNWENCQF